MYGRSTVDCADMLLGLPYQQARNVVYHAKSHQYKIQKDGCTYTLKSVTTPPKTPTVDTDSCVHLSQCLSLCLVRPLKDDNLTNPTPPEIKPLLQEFADIFVTPTGLPPSRVVEHTIDLVSRVVLPNVPAYRLSA